MPLLPVIGSKASKSLFLTQACGEDDVRQTVGLPIYVEDIMEGDGIFDEWNCQNI